MDKLKDLENDVETNKKLEDLEENKFLKILKEAIPYIVILIVVVTIRTYLVTPIIVSGDSMNTTLKDGEVMLLNKKGKIDRFSIVVVNIPNEKIIKRVIGLPGETISCENGIIYINDRKLDESYGSTNTPDFEKVKIGDDEYFVLGDNRSNSFDSEDFGPVKEDKLIGTANIVLFPFNKIGKVK